MHARNILLFASVLLPVIGAPVPTKEINSIQQRSANVLSQLSSYISKREPHIERIPVKAFPDVVFEAKRDADTEDALAIDGDDDDFEEEEKDVVDLGVDSSEVDPTKRGLRGTAGAGGHKRNVDGNGVVGDKRGLRGTAGAGGHKRSVDGNGVAGDKRGLRGTAGAGGHKRSVGGNGVVGDKRGLRGTGGAGGHKRGLRGTAGAGGHKRGLRGTGGAGGHKRSLFARFFDSFLA